MEDNTNTEVQDELLTTTISFEKEQYERLKIFCKKNSMKISPFVRAAVDKHFERISSKLEE